MSGVQVRVNGNTIEIYLPHQPGGGGPIAGWRTVGYIDRIDAQPALGALQTALTLVEREAFDRGFEAATL